MTKILAATAGVVALVAVFLVLRDATLSTHQRVDPNSSIELVVRVSLNGNERGQNADEIAEALISSCRLEVNSDPVGEPRRLDHGRYRVRLVPSMDRTDQRQFRGCIEDWTIDHVRADVERLTPFP